ncbi:MAG: hypothetical protein K2Q10_04060, partial [Rhodospirillales bacterium]|nr:hypothetical protein [Rhodospirillales bacterium]
GLSKVIRDRSRMTRRVRALSAEGRLSALVLASLPFLVVGAITVLNPDYYGAVRGDPLLVPLLGGGTTGIVVGCAMMYRMVNFRI